MFNWIVSVKYLYLITFNRVKKMIKINKIIPIW